MNPSIEDLQRRIAELQLGKTQPISEVPKESSDLKDIIREVLREELTSLKDSTPIPDKTPAKPMTLLESIGTSLSEEEQLWLSKPDILPKVGEFLPLFFQTEEGKHGVKAFLKYFRGCYEA